MTYKRHKMYESQKRDYIESGDITQTQTYKRPQLTPTQQKELYDKGSITITIKAKVIINKGYQSTKQVKDIEKNHDDLITQLRKNHEKNLSKGQKNSIFTYIRWGFVRIFPDGTSDPNNEQGYMMYPGHPEYKNIIQKNINPQVIEDFSLWQGGFMIKTFINLKKEDNTYDILDEYEYKQ